MRASSKSKQIKQQIAIWVVLLLFSMPLMAEVSIVTHPANELDELTQAEVRALYSLKKKRWPNGQPVHLIVMHEDSTVHQQFCKETLGIFSHSLRRAWDRRIFSGMAQEPLKAKSEEDMRRLISETPGAIGYLSNSTDAAGTKAITVR